MKKAFKILLPLFLGAFILYWVYRDFDFAQVSRVLLDDTHWGWMLLSLIPGTTGHLFRGWRWKQTLEPLGEHPRSSNCVDAIFLSYAANLVLPRVGEVSRCGVLAKYDNVSFAKSLGTVVTERLVDTLCILLITGITFLLQMPVFLRFFAETGTKIPSLTHLVTSPWFYVSLFCVVGVVVLLYYLMRMLSFYEHVKGVVLNVWQGIMSLRSVRNVPLFIVYTLFIWVSYFLHFYLTFHCFSFTAPLGLLPALVMFVAGTFAVIVPTPNGAGPWHFAIITMMMLYGISPAQAAVFALIVHGIQTLLVILLGVYGWLHLNFNKEWSAFMRFVLVGGVATALHYGLYYLMLNLLPANIAYTLGYLLSFIVNFYLTAYFTFGTAPSWKRAFGFSGAHLVNYGLHIVLLNLFLWMGLSEQLAPLPVFAIAVPVNFLLVRFVFSRKKTSN